MDNNTSAALAVGTAAATYSFTGSEIMGAATLLLISGMVIGAFWKPKIPSLKKPNSTVYEHPTE